MFNEKIEVRIVLYLVNKYNSYDEFDINDALDKKLLQ